MNHGITIAVGVLALGVAFVAMQRRGVMKHRLFALHLVLYGTFRFFVEFLRDSRLYVGPLSAYQLFSVAMIACGIWSLRRHAPARDASAAPLAA